MSPTYPHMPPRPPPPPLRDRTGRHWDPDSRLWRFNLTGYAEVLRVSMGWERGEEREEMQCVSDGAWLSCAILSLPPTGAP